jgi:hypothetical protein
MSTERITTYLELPFTTHKSKYLQRATAVEPRLYYYGRGYDIVMGPRTVDSQVPITFTVQIWSSLVHSKCRELLLFLLYEYS